MNQIPDVCDDAAYLGTMCSKFAAPRQRKKFPIYQRFDVEIGSASGMVICRGAAQMGVKTCSRQ
jgi:hypothetical protein